MYFHFTLFLFILFKVNKSWYMSFKHQVNTHTHTHTGFITVFSLFVSADQAISFT